MEWTLDQMPLGQEAVVLQIEENSMLGRRMREMGITEGVRICLQAPSSAGRSFGLYGARKRIGNPQYGCSAYPCPPGAYICCGRFYKPPQRALNLFLPICLTAEPKNGGKGRAKYAKSNDRAGGKSQLR